MSELLLMNIYRDSSVNTALSDSIGQHLIAAYLGTKVHSAKVFSGRGHEARRILEEQIAQGILAVGFYISADNKSITANLVKWVKEHCNLCVFVGGPEAISCNEDFFRETMCDFAIENEGEEPVRLLLEYLLRKNIALSEIPNLKYLGGNGSVVKNDISYYVENLDTMPNPDSRNSLNAQFRMGKEIGLITGRGCPYHCAFCYEGANAKRVRFRSVQNVMAEIDEVLAKNPKLEIINFYDDTFTLIPERVVQFCSELKKRNLQWVCEGHISNLIKNPALVKRMVDAGMVGMQIGIESGSDRVLAAYRKNTTAADLIDVVELCKKAGLPCLEGNFIIGGAFENRSTYEDSLVFAKKAIEVGRGMFECRSVFLAPYPYTLISKEPEKYGLHIDQKRLKQTLYSMQSPVMYTDALSIEEISNLRIDFNLEIEKKYREQAFLCTRTEVENGILLRGKITDRNSSWYESYRVTEHINEYIKNAILTQEMFCECYYPIRTFSDMDYSKLLRLDPTEEQFLALSHGTLCLREIGEKLYLKGYQLKTVYERLNERCLVYLSEF